MFKRKIQLQLEAWKSSENHKPLVVKRDMKNIRFAVLAMLVAVAMTGCKKSDIDKTILSITEVTETSISGKCVYTPEQENDGGYLIFLSRTEEVTDEMRNAMIEVYSTNQPHHENMSFTFDFLASDRTYYIMAVTFCNKEGKVAIDKFETLAQRTLASNDNRVTYEFNDKKNVSIGEVTIALLDNSYTVNLYDLVNPAMKSPIGEQLNLKVEVNNMGVVDAIDEENQYKGNNQLVCTIDFGSWEDLDVEGVPCSGEAKTLYGFVPTAGGNKYTKYKATVTGYKSAWWGRLIAF